MRLGKFGAAAALAVVMAHPASATRPWHKPPRPAEANATAQQLAMDYVHIMDMRSMRELVSVQWLPPLAMMVEPGDKAMFDRFVIIAVAHVSTRDDSKSIDTHDDETPAAFDADGHPLEPVLNQEQPDGLKKFLAYKRDLVRQAKLPDELLSAPVFLRALMEGYIRNLRFYAFRSGAVRDCTSGRLTVDYAGDKYTFDTPLPGCAPASGGK